MPPKKPPAKKPAAKKEAPKMTWMSHVKKTFEDEKKKNDKYSYKQAMSDAKKSYRK